MIISSSMIVEQLINGLITGASYALVGSGLSLIWGALKMVNVAHGEFYMLGAYFLWIFVTKIGLPVYLSVVIAILIVMAICAVLQLATIRPLIGKPGWDMSPYILTLGISIFFQNFALRVWSERYQNVPYFSDRIFKLFGTINMSAQRILILIVSLSVICVLMFMIKFTKLGRAIRATSQEPQSALMMGINIKMIYLVTYVISGALAAVAGVMLAPIYSVNPWMGNAVQLKGLVVCILGGLGYLEGSILAGILVGTAEGLGVIFVGSAWKDVISYLLLIVMLWVRPNGIFGKKVGEA